MPGAARASSGDAGHVVMAVEVLRATQEFLRMFREERVESEHNWVSCSGLDRTGRYRGLGLGCRSCASCSFDLIGITG